MSKRISVYSLIGVGLFAFIAFYFSENNKQIEAGSDEETPVLIWSDEFDVDGLPNSQNWSYDIGSGCDLPCGCGWGNNEKQYYTNSRRENARVKDGHLIIEARKEDFQQSAYTSARLISKNKGDWTYGRIDIKAKIPGGRGAWPAIWMLPTENKYGIWPKSGEIDIMEHVGYQPDSIYGTVHTDKYNGMIGNQRSGQFYSAIAESEFHVYSIQWDDNNIKWLIDDQLYNTFSNQHEGSEQWPFDQAFHLILNVAVGGNWGGKHGIDDAIWPRQMLVDYVRVYK